MSKQTAVVDVSSFTTDAKFRTWGSAASTAIQATGLTKTSDTGQINWTTVSKPTATLTKAGYEIYRFNDTLQATKSIYLRIDYGSSGATTGNGPSTWVTIGTGTDGAGNITGLFLGPFQSGYTGTTTSANTGMTMQFCYSATYGYLFLNFGMNVLGASGTAGQSVPGFYIIERTKDAAGASSGSGVRFLVSIATTGASWGGLADRAINFDTSIMFPTARNPHSAMLSNSYSLSSGGNVATYRHYAGAGGAYPVIGCVTFYTGDVPTDTSFTATPVGATAHTYFAWSPAYNADVTANAAAILAYMWED